MQAHFSFITDASIIIQKISFYFQVFSHCKKRGNIADNNPQQKNSGKQDCQVRKARVKGHFRNLLLREIDGRRQQKDGEDGSRDSLDDP